MAVALTTQTQRADKFNQMILGSLKYWQDWLETKIANVAVVDRERDKIVKSISFALDLDAAWPVARELIITFSPYMERRGYWDTWNWVLSRSIKAAHRLGDAEGAATLSALFARLLRRQSRFRESIAYYRRAIRMSRQMGDHFNEARACTNLGYYYIDQGYWHRAEVLCCHALTLFEQLDNNHGRAHTENHLGFLYTQQCLWDKAQRHLEQACAIWESMADKYGLMYGYMNLGKLYYDLERANDALAYEEQALVLAELTGDEDSKGIICMNIGIIHTKLTGNVATAETYLLQAETIFRHNSDARWLAQAQEYLGVLYTARQNWPEALSRLKTALAAWRSLCFKYNEIRTVIHLAEYALLKQNRSQAKAWLRQAASLLDQYDATKRYCQLHHQLEKVNKRFLPTI